MIFLSIALSRLRREFAYHDFLPAENVCWYWTRLGPCGGS
jgi:hypothetical protein